MSDPANPIRGGTVRNLPPRLLFPLIGALFESELLQSKPLKFTRSWTI
ncbi:hypothetical protein MESS4_830143 [Mesorhizobium sp. STM 4661]|nr:hypothetical protein MESS4_830143 [Mesorhizobium sp. STM 4661]